MADTKPEARFRSPATEGPPPAGEAFYREEVQLALRNRGMPLEALRYDVTPDGLHYLLTHFDIPYLDAGAWRLNVDGLVSTPAEPRPGLDPRAACPHADRDARVRRQRPRPDAGPLDQPALAGRGGEHGELDRRAAQGRAGAGRTARRRRRRAVPRRRPGHPGRGGAVLRAQPLAGETPCTTTSCWPTR